MEKVNSVYFEAQCLPYCCGVIDVGDFSDSSNRWSTSLSRWIDGKSEELEVDPRDAAFIQAEFINNSICKQAYLEMCQRFTKIYQSPVRKNPSTGNELFMCVFIPKD